MDIIRKKNIRKKTSGSIDAIEKIRDDVFYYSNIPSPRKIQLHNYNNDFDTKKNSGFRRKFLLFTFFLILLIISLFSYFLWKINYVGEKIILNSDKNKENYSSDLSGSITTETELRGEKDGRINILMLGIAGENKPGKNLTDTIIIMSINTVTKKIGMLSLPRDLYTNIPETKNYTKINSIYQYGLDENQGITPIKEAVNNITGLDIHYFMVIDFEGFEKIIDNLGGINVNVERDIYDSRYPGPNYSYETFEIKKGLHKMDGSTALKYARQRHNDPEGDFGRAKRQQQVIQAAKNKVFSLKTLFNFIALNNLLNTLGEHIKTDIRIDEIRSFISLSRRLDTQNISTAVIDAWKKESLLKVSHIFIGNIRAFILVPRVGNYSEIQELAHNIFDLNFIARKKEEIEKEKTTLAIINTTDDSELTNKIVGLLQDKLSFDKISIIKNSTNQKLSSTLIFDNTERLKPFSLDEIAGKLPAIITDNKNAIIKDEKIENYDFLLMLGTDLIPLYSFEEDSFEDMQNTDMEQMDFNQIKYE
ncbi:MAG: hypothetical protein UR69_C0002G0160 [Candidatus Moranbacteria bacterium GW2011_GWE2_35_2-]|nr:MAG: hypothetical protein UR69_C0002G0160 [Candidatus Moranbacteria bacterium GW2011_GWE2_35_2-]KKQ06761.1 MAG: hypothetical protein US15_C0004G0008 [Candidatus Moranbacteria bacterium GW2011_GWF1_36_4]KKQ22490.1 MAG: hypothetical protein US37_C0002G0115 [Candidatus Moranbacteria bacterium GW2011_GWF2_37_11]KKQ29559.1 MAG: hypothetical protein US44_C0001G0151 [Candidatus Moranbacteria bacterium GW2011_GWD1_37_17]KKQ30570.1 MAG: hypothetical protein US47_C0002G0160 [Candidatus Moranbacteria b